MSDNLFKEIWNRRSLIILLSFNDVKLRYRNSVLGFFWTFLEPLLMLSVLYLVFTNLMKNQIEDYPLYLLLGLIIWYMFLRATSFGLSSLISKADIIQKIYFRREIVVISSCLTAFMMMVFEFIAFGVFMVAFAFTPPITIVFLSLVLVDLFLLSVGVSLILSVFNIYFRDIQFIWQVVMQAGFFITPIFYTLDMFPEGIRWILKLNPLVHILDMSRGFVLHGTLPSIHSTIYVVGFTIGVLIVGLAVFRYKGKRIVEQL